MNALSTAPPPPKPCFICSSMDSCISIPSIAGSQYLCLLHYYTTGAHRNASTKDTDKRPSKRKRCSLLVDNRTIHGQLPQVQDIFAEAFTDLQKEISEESARVFKSAADSDDPLAMLLDNNAPSQPIRRSFVFTTSTSSSKKKTKSAGKESDSGF